MNRDFATLCASATVDEALALFQSKHSLYPVVDEQKRMVGALRRVALYDWLAHHGLERSPRLSELQLGALVRTRPETPVPQILEDLIRTGASKAVVVDDEQRLQGIVALYDLIGGADSPRSTPH